MALPFGMLHQPAIAFALLAFIAVMLGGCGDKNPAGPNPPPSDSTGPVPREIASLSSTNAFGDNSSQAASISEDGRYVAFQTQAANLVPDDTNGTTDVYVRDLIARTTVRVSVASYGRQSVGWVSRPHISGNGRYVAFYSSAGDLDPNSAPHGGVFIHDLQTRETTLVRAGMVILNMGHAISDDGRYLAVYGQDPSANYRNAILRIDRQGGPDKVASVTYNGSAPDGYFVYGSLSGDGRRIAFSTASSNILPDGNGGSAQIYLRDFAAETTTRLSKADGGGPASGESSFVDLSNDGSIAAFASGAPLTSDDTNGVLDIFVCTIATGALTRVSETSTGGQATLDSVGPALSGDGRYIGFYSRASELVDPDGYDHILVHDRLTHGLRQVTLPRKAGRSSGGIHPALSNRAAFVAFESLSIDMVVPSDANMNISHIFVFPTVPVGSG